MFIVIEGNDGAGKTSVAKLIAERLRKKKLSVFHTFEPGAGDENDSLRKKLLKKGPHSNNASRDLILFLHSRLCNISKINDALNKNKDTIIICDRYYYSSVVYQGYISEIHHETYQYPDKNKFTMKNVYQLNKLLFPDMTPDLVFFLLAPAEIASERCKSLKSLDFIDIRPITYRKNILVGYKKLIEYLRKFKESETIEYYDIDTETDDKIKVANNIFTIIMKRLSD